MTLEDQNDIFNGKDDTIDVKKIQAYKTSLEYKNALDKFMEYYLNGGIISNGIEIDGEEIYSAEIVRNILLKEKGVELNFERATNYFVKNFKDNIENIYSRLNQKYRDVYVNVPIGDPRRDEAIAKSMELSRLLKEKGGKLIRDYFKKIKTKIKFSNIYKLFITDIEQYVSVLSEKEILE